MQPNYFTSFPSESIETTKLLSLVSEVNVFSDIYHIAYFVAKVCNSISGPPEGQAALETCSFS